MKKVTLPRQVSRLNYLQLLFVFVAFALMAFASYFFIGRILQSRLLSGANELLFSAEANIKAGLSEAETTLNNSYYILQNMVERNASSGEILEYLNITSEWMRKREKALMSYYGIYGYINNEFFDSMGFKALGNYIPQRQPWYQAAIRSGRSLAYTRPYEDARTGDTIISVVRNIDIKNSEIAGILSVDVSIHWLTDYISSLKLSPDGYGMLLNMGGSLITHPNSALVGSQLQVLGEDYKKIEQTLRNGGDVFARRVTDLNGVTSIVFFKQIFNGWYVGIVTPYSQFYSDLFVSAKFLAALGIVLALALCFILLRLSAAKIRADEESKLKSSFLANMSHEIRTPMNAITGMAELLLRGNLSEEARGYALDIKHAGNNLVSIINDILDISKIEAGKLEIIPVKYLLSSIISDTANIIFMRIGEKPLRFYTNIDGNIPNSLIGDEMRIRQVLLNLLSNAVKYSDKGHIGLTIMLDKREGKQIMLKIAVNDTGKGIKPEDQAKLFDEFMQVDTKKNRGIEGTGLGLAITKRLCVAMGGDITLESEYGKGSTFTAFIPQTVESEEPFAAAVLNDKADSKHYYDNAGTGVIRYVFPGARILVVDDIATNLKVAEGLLAPYGATVDTCISGIRAVELVQQREYDIIFMDHMMPEMDGIEATAAIRAWEKEQRTKAVPIIALTANAVVGMREMFIEKGLNDFIAKPIDVSKLDEALNKWMPKEKRGTRDQGLGTGDSAPKSAGATRKKSGDMDNSSGSYPNIANHDSLVPSTQSPVPGIDMQKGIAMSGGTPEVYRDVLIIFRKDAQERLPLLQAPPTADTLSQFITNVHGLKSASGSIGAADLSARAAALESAGKAGDLTFIKENLPVFTECLSRLIDGILVWEEAEKKIDSKKQTTAGAIDPDIVMPLLRELAEALKSLKGDVIDLVLEKIARQPLDADTKTAVDQISDEILVAEYDKAGKILESLIKEN